MSLEGFLIGVRTRVRLVFLLSISAICALASLFFLIRYIAVLDGGIVSAILGVDWIFALIFAIILAYAAFTFSLRLPYEPYTLSLVLAALAYLVFTSARGLSPRGLPSIVLLHLGDAAVWIFFVFGFYFPSPRGARTWRMAAIAGTAVPYIAFIAVNLHAYVSWTLSDGPERLRHLVFLGKMGSILNDVMLIALALLLLKAYLKVSSPGVRSQLKWILSGMLIALPPCFFFDQLPTLMSADGSGGVGLGGFSQVFLSVIPIFLIVGLTRHRVLDLRFLLTRYVVLIALFLLMLAGFYVLYLPLRDALASGYGLEFPQSDLLAAAVIFLVLVPLRSLIAKAVDRATDGIPRPESRHTERSPTHAATEEEGIYHERTLKEFRAILRGLISRLRVQNGSIMAAAAALDSSARAEEGDFSRGICRALQPVMKSAVETRDFLDILDSFCGPSVSIPAYASPELLVRTALERVKRRLPDARFAVTIQASEKLICYPEELIDAFTFVLQNAAEAQEGSPEAVDVRTTLVESRILIEVEDAGPGIKRNDPGLFTPFFTTKPGHAGLGLYVARLITLRHGGLIQISPREGGGSRVRFVFPHAPVE
jgi:signal transduction histidine kinase